MSWQQQVVATLRAVLGKLDGFVDGDFKLSTVSAGNGESIDTVGIKCPKTFGLDTDRELKKALPPNSVHFFGHRSPDWNPFGGANAGSFDVVVAQGAGFQGVLRAAQTCVPSAGWDTERLIREFESIKGLEIDVLFAETDFIAADFICSSNFQAIAEELKRVCPDLYVGTGFKPNATSLASLLEQDEAHISCTWTPPAS
jgi:hypothetical protein